MGKNSVRRHSSTWHRNVTSLGGEGEGKRGVRLGMGGWRVGEGERESRVSNRWVGREEGEGEWRVRKGWLGRGGEGKRSRARNGWMEGLGWVGCIRGGRGG